MDADDAPEDLVVVPVDIPDDVDVTEVTARSLPGDWRSIPAPARLQRLGADWVRAGKTAVLSVPSAVVPRERNYVFNPRHPDFARLKRGKPEPFRIDPRLQK
jgi:RES domain-containing protein